MATISEWIRDFKKLKKWEKVGIIVGILGLLGLPFAANYIVNINSVSSQTTNINNSGKNSINIQNSSVINSPMIQDSSNVSVVYNPDDTFGLDYDQYPRIHTLKTHKDFTTFYLGGKANLYFVKVIVADRKEAFLEEILFNKEYAVSRCNMELTDCIINPKFRPNKDLTEDQICWTFISRFSDKNLTYDELIPSKKFQIDRDKCFKSVE